jgi:hypothetical protein
MGAARQTIEEPRQALLAFRQTLQRDVSDRETPISYGNGPILLVGTSEHEAA